MRTLVSGVVTAIQGERKTEPHLWAPLWPLAMARILMGLLWLTSLRWKLPPDFDGGSERSLAQWLQLEVDHAAIDVYGRLIESVVIPNVTLFSWLLFLTELAVGLSLLTGTFTRFGALIGLALSLNLGLGLAAVPGEWPWSYAMMAMWHGTLFVSGAGRLWGVDHLLEHRARNRAEG